MPLDPRFIEAQSQHGTHTGKIADLIRRVSWLERAASRSFAAQQIASATTVTMQGTPRLVTITGTTAITNITITRPGHVVTLLFQGALTVNDGTGNLMMAGNFTTSSDDTLTLVCNGLSWYEIGRSAN